MLQKLPKPKVKDIEVKLRLCRKQLASIRTDKNLDWK